MYVYMRWLAVVHSTTIHVFITHRKTRVMLLSDVNYESILVVELFIHVFI